MIEGIKRRIRTKRDTFALLYVLSALLFLGLNFIGIEELVEIKTILITYFGIIGTLYAAEKGIKDRPTLDLPHGVIRTSLILITGTGIFLSLQGFGSFTTDSRDIFIEILVITLARFFNRDTPLTPEHWDLPDTVQQDALFLAKLSNLTYKEEAVIKEQAGLSDIQLFPENDVGTEGFTGVKDTCLYVVVRGTNDPEDIFQNLKLKQVQYEESDSGAKCHRGFYNQFQSIKSHIDEQLDQHGANLKCVYGTGHSLGGAVVSLAATYIGIKTDLKPKVITFGAPRHGDSGMAELTEQNTEVYVRFHNVENDAADPVPKVPIGLLTRWQHVGPSYIVAKDCKPNLNRLSFYSFSDVRSIIQGYQIQIPKDKSIPAHGMEKYYLPHLHDCINGISDDKQSVETGSSLQIN